MRTQKFGEAKAIILLLFSCQTFRRNTVSGKSFTKFELIGVSQNEPHCFTVARKVICQTLCVHKPPLALLAQAFA